MTSAERWKKIENLLLALTEGSVRHDETLARQEEEIDKLNAAIRDLIVVSRTRLDSQKESHEDQKRTAASMQELRDLHKDTEEKLNALIHRVDRLIRSRNGDE